jgi:predicted Zn-dependent peptidase
MLDEGAGELDALQFGDALQALGATFRTGADHEAVFTSLTVLKRNFDRAAELVADALRRPNFTTEDWERVKRVHLDSLRQQDDEPATVASRVAARTYFGADHPYGWPAEGTTDTVEAMNLEDVRREYTSLVRPEFATVLLAGDISAGEARNLLERTLGDWEPRARTIAQVEPLQREQQKELKVYVVDRQEAVQTVIRFALPGPTYTTDRRVDYRLLNTLLGGSFTSRLNMNLREEHGYTYGARSSFVMEPSVGYFTAAASVRADVTGESLKEFLHELTRAQKGDITPEEAAKAQATLRADIIESFAGLNGVISEASQRVTAGLPFATVADDINRIPKVKDSDLNAMGPEAIRLNSGVLVLVGDKKVILPQIESLVPTPVEVDIRGRPVSAGRSSAGTN